MMRLREDSPASLPTSGPDPWIVRIVLRRTGVAGLVLPPQAAQAGDDLMVVELKPETVQQLGGPRGIPRAFEADRRRFAAGAIRAGFRDGYAVELVVERGHRRRLWAVPEGVRA